MAKKGKNKGTVPTKYAEVKVNHGIFEDYLQYGPQYDTVNDCPVIPSETEFVPRQRLGTNSVSLGMTGQSYPAKRSLFQDSDWENSRKA